MVLSQLGLKRRLDQFVCTMFFIDQCGLQSGLQVTVRKKQTNQEGNVLSTLEHNLFPGLTSLFNFAVLWGTGDWQVLETGYRMEWVNSSGAYWKWPHAAWLIDYQIYSGRVSSLPLLQSNQYCMRIVYLTDFLLLLACWVLVILSTSAALLPGHVRLGFCCWFAAFGFVSGLLFVCWKKPPSLITRSLEVFLRPLISGSLSDMFIEIQIMRKICHLS